MDMDPMEDMLSYDPLASAERITGMSYKDSDATMLLGAQLAMAHGKLKSDTLTVLGDTTLFNELDRYQQIITEMGFEQVLDLSFTSPGYRDEEMRHEHFFVYAHRDGMLLAFDTYNGTSVNGGHLYYCWKPSVERYWNYTSSGTVRMDENGDAIWCGYHDAREAIRHNVANLRKNGTLVSPWIKGNNIFLWLLHYQDIRVEKYDHDAITKERIAMLPQWVRDMIGW